MKIDVLLDDAIEFLADIEMAVGTDKCQQALIDVLKAEHPQYDEIFISKVPPRHYLAMGIIYEKTPGYRPNAREDGKNYVARIYDK